MHPFLRQRRRLGSHFRRGLWFYPFFRKGGGLYPFLGHRRRLHPGAGFDPFLGGRGWRRFHRLLGQAQAFDGGAGFEGLGRDFGNFNLEGRDIPGRGHGIRPV